MNAPTGTILTCSQLYTCCSCGGNDCGCHYCFDCHACDACKDDREEQCEELTAQ